MTEWEQLKKEYEEIPVPANGPHQMLEVIAKAKQKRNQWKQAARYGTVAAAALLLLLFPGMLLFSGGFGAKSDNAYMEADCAIAEGASSDGWLKGDRDSTKTPATNNMLSQEIAADSAVNAGGNSNAAEESQKYSVDSTGVASEDVVRDEAEELKTEVLWAGERENISKEVLRQMEERMQDGNETYYIKSKEYPDGFELVALEQKCYINEEGLLVIVFEAGTVAPKGQGEIEFIIPAEVFSLEE